MSYRKFKFMSPGIFINEIDNSQLPKQPTGMGPALIGRFSQGPALKPVQVNSFAEFIDIFGAPDPGQRGGDVWRDRIFLSPTYAAYAAQAWFRNNSPVTVVRLLGQTNTDATTNSAYAGWKTTNIDADTVGTSNGGAYGLFITEGSSTLTSSAGPGWAGGATTGTLAAVWYLNAGSCELSGQSINTSSVTYITGSSTWVRAVGTGPEFKVIIKNGSGTTQIESAFNFDKNSPGFIRKVFNTNPTLTNASLTPTGGTTLTYWLGESFEGNLTTFKGSGSAGYSTGISGSIANQNFGVILKLAQPNGDVSGGDFTMGPTKSPLAQFAKTGWFISQDMTTNAGSYNPTNMQKLFRLCARELGEETQRKVKVSISKIAASNDLDNPYGKFTVLVRKLNDTDAAPKILEQYNDCDLNPASENYIAKKIGNKFQQWDDDDRRYRYYGEYTNVSDYVYVEVNDQVAAAATTAEFLPYGVYGPTRYLGWSVSGSDGQGTAPTGAFLCDYGTANTASDAPTGPFVLLTQTGPTLFATAGSGTFNTASTGDTMADAACSFPQLRLRAASNENDVLTDPRSAYFGVDTNYFGTSFDRSVIDVLRTKADDLSGVDEVTSKTEVSWIFSLDDITNAAVTGTTYAGSYSTNAVWVSGSRVAGRSYTAHTSSADDGTDGFRAGPLTASWRNVIDQSSEFGGTTAGWKQFTTCLAGGADGLDITEKDPFNNTRALSSGKTSTTAAAYNSINVAIDSLRDPEVVEYNLVTMPGVTSNTLNQKLIDMCENRGDALAIVDLQGGYKPSAENKQTQIQRKGDVQSTINNRRTQAFNSSYGCAYYPWVQIRDTINGSTLWAPPSVVALGAMSYGQANSQLWFAPAGFTRGGLSVQQAGGIPVIGVEDRLTAKKRDDLYEAGINPIATFPAEGIVIFGQKTLQLTSSALDRINVRRLVIFLKKQISRFAATTLFDQNVQATWTRFKSKVIPFLGDVKAGLGVTDFKMILDESTTTPDLIDRNILYAKIYVKPARAIEYIAIDFIITDSGASFED